MNALLANSTPSYFCTRLEFLLFFAEFLPAQREAARGDGVRARRRLRPAARRRARQPVRRLPHRALPTGRNVAQR